LFLNLFGCGSSALCLSVDEHIANVLAAMQGAAKELG
jgi:hypothetical protein